MGKVIELIGKSSSKFGRIYKYDHPQLFPENSTAEYLTFYPSRGRYIEGNIMVCYWAKEENIDLKKRSFPNNQELEPLF